jgi:hypothetical protein
MMKNDELYPEFITYLNNQLNEGSIGKGKFSLLKMSLSYFQTFSNKFNKDELFRNRVIELHKSVVRDKKIDDIFNDFD